MGNQAGEEEESEDCPQISALGGSLAFPTPRASCYLVRGVPLFSS